MALAAPPCNDGPTQLRVSYDGTQMCLGAPDGVYLVAMPCASMGTVTQLWTGFGASTGLRSSTAGWCITMCVCRASGAGPLGVRGLGFQTQGSRFRVQHLGFRVWACHAMRGKLCLSRCRLADAGKHSIYLHNHIISCTWNMRVCGSFN